jgi:LacI family transcriptional regulator
MHHFFSNIINAIIDEAEKRNWIIILQSLKPCQKKQVELLINKGLTGSDVPFERIQ